MASRTPSTPRTACPTRGPPFADRRRRPPGNRAPPAVVGTHMKKIRTLALLLAFVLFAAACGDDSSDVDTSSGDGTTGDGTAGSDTVDGTLAVQVLVDGGFVPVDVSLRTVPQVTVTAAGTVITG